MVIEIDLAPEEQIRLEQQALHAGIPFQDWVRHRLLDGPPAPTNPTAPVVTFTTDDGEVFEIPDLPKDVARAIASEEALGRFWNRREENATWNDVYPSLAVPLFQR